ncbi:hypothetical protein, partial [Pseudomarimonas arenosa]
DFEAPQIIPDGGFIVRGNRPQITGDAIAPNIEVKPDPYLVVHSYEQLSRFAFKVDQSSVVNVKLLPPGSVDPNDPGALTLVSNETLASEVLREVQWTGKDEVDSNFVLTEGQGMFNLLITATSVRSGVTAKYLGVLHLEN